VDPLSDFLRFETGALLNAFALVVVYRILTGGINTAGLLLDKETRQLSAARVQSLMISLGVAGYVSSATFAGSSDMLPDIPDSVLVLLFGSQAAYLGAKGGKLAVRLLAGRISGG